MDKLTFIVEPAEEGGYNAHAESEAIFTQADTIEELNFNISGTIGCHFDNTVLPGFTVRFVE